MFKYRFHNKKLRNKYLVSSAALLCAISMTSTATAAEIQAGDEIKISTTLTAGDTTGGGAWVTEKDKHWKRGVITAIEVCAGAYVNSITPYYDGKRGTTFGGPGGNCGIPWEVPIGEYIQSVEVWSGAWMNKITFTTNKLSKSPEFGGPGGNRKVWEDPNSGSLRKIDGKYGDYMNGVKLGFSYPYYMDNFRYTRLSELENPIKFRPIQQVNYQTVNGCRSASETSQEVTVNESFTETHSFSFGGSATIGLETTLEAGIPDIASVGVTSRAEISATFENAESTESQASYEVKINGIAPPGIKKEIITKLTKADVTIPFTYDLIHYRGNNKRRHVGKKTYNGVYTGVRVASVETEQVDIDCITGKPSITTDTRTPNPAPAPVREPTVKDEPRVPPSETLHPAEITPATVRYVSTTSGAAFKEVEDGLWQELSDTGDVRFNYAVIDIDDDCVYLMDIDRGIIIILDLTRDVVGYSPDLDTEAFDLYTISSKS